jgi:hypothetical protein
MAWALLVRARLGPPTTAPTSPRPRRGAPPLRRLLAALAQLPVRMRARWRPRRRRAWSRFPLNPPCCSLSSRSTASQLAARRTRAPLRHVGALAWPNRDQRPGAAPGTAMGAYSVRLGTRLGGLSGRARKALRRLPRGGRARRAATGGRRRCAPRLPPAALAP